MNNTSSFKVLFLIALIGTVVGCKSEPADRPEETPAEAVEKAPASDAPAESEATAAMDDPESQPGVIVMDADQLLANRLPAEQASQGWVRLFDGQTFFGWQIASQANWQIDDGVLSVDDGEKGLICTTMRWRDYQLSLEFKASPETNSGVFLRTNLFPTDPTVDCYELNIASVDNPFPTGSLVQREPKSSADIAAFDYDVWHRYDIRVEGATVNVKLDGVEILNYVDPNPLPAGLIGLQYNGGPAAFRDIRVRPLGLDSLISEKIEDHWVRYPEMEGDYQMTDDGMQITGGRAQLESKAQYDDFALLAEVRTNAAALNSGIFFRCIPGDVMMGYECQISNATIEGDPMFPADCGTGGFFRRKDARIVAADDQEWFSMLLIADGSTMATWVNGLQVSEWSDDRDPDANPRKGQRLEAGTLMLQAHDPTTDIHIRQLAVATLAAPVEEAKPEAKEEVEPEATEEAKEEPKPEMKEEAKPEAKEEPQPEAKEEAKEAKKPEVKEEAKPEAKEEAKPEVKEEAKPEAAEETKE
ncbi:3-keto-disaccharide hydrolase [Rosistilla oblonga]|uniref:3-keto-alpha-glucoside-1,2-lyase/3-keto-2-hydroxy-glucal hydratase domain-containing protein n=1 Tax=Rosistilla oblonga TaxID=2527990 RepID=A0A518IU11_9BACT|nr:DUF1080 domain-containing protein [Rosistilla oblonga]QDV56575.1 hypothetical protein Mal33_25670 [Rosistilla oblonga]